MATLEIEGLRFKTVASATQKVFLLPRCTCLVASPFLIVHCAGELSGSIRVDAFSNAAPS